MKEGNNRHEDERNAYDILLRRHLNDDRLMGERSSVFLASSSILFIGFALLPTTAWVIRVIIPCLGLIWSFLAMISNRRTSIALDFWESCEERMEKDAESFAYMREKEIAPHRFYKVVKKNWLTRPRNRHIFSLLLPSLFIILWISSLVWVIVN